LRGDKSPYLDARLNLMHAEAARMGDNSSKRQVISSTTPSASLFPAFRTWEVLYHGMFSCQAYF
jgi:hypothetical protein